MMLLFVVLALTQFEETSSSKVLAGYAVTALKETVKKANQFYNSLKDDNDITPGDVVLSYVDTIPVVGDIIRALTDSSDYEDEMREVTNNILAQLKSLSEIQGETLYFLQKLQNDINLAVFKIQIATASKIINSCHTDLTLFLQNPKAIPEHDRFLKCYYTAITEIRHLGRIVTEKEYTMESPKLFSFMITKDGFCNGTKIIRTYKYLFGLIVLGCETAVLSEAVKYGNTSSTFSRECSTLIQDIEEHMGVIYSGCINDNCSQVINVLISVIQNYYDKPLNETAVDIRMRLPWFSFTIYMFNQNPGELMMGNLLPSSVTIQYGYTFFIILWTPYKLLLDPGHNFLSFFLQFDATYFNSEYEGMTIFKNIASKPAIAIGYFGNDASKDSYNRCSRPSRITLAPEPKNLNNTNRNCSVFPRPVPLMLIVSYILKLIIL